MDGLAELSAEGKRLEVCAALRNTRSQFNAMYEALDPNSPEADELALLITELRLSGTRLGDYS